MKWLETHRHLAITLVLAGASVLLGLKWMAHADGVAHDRRVLAEAQLKQDRAAQTAKEAQAAADRLAYDNLKAEMDRQNSALRSQNAVLMAALSARQQQDRQLPPSELATRWEGLIGAVPGSVKPLPEGLLATLPAAQETVVRLEEVPVLRQERGNLEGIIANKDKEAAALLTRAISAEDAGAACRKTQESMEKSCDLRVKDEVARSRKHGLWGSIGSFIAGVLFGRKL